MSFVYRPTPVVVLSGKTVGTDHVPLRRLPAGTMHGYTPNMASPALNAIGRRTISGNPWLLASGTMNGFLGQDDGPILFSDVSPIDTTLEPSGSLLTPPPFSPSTPVFLPQPSDLNLQPTTYEPTGTLIASTFQPSASSLPSGLSPGLVAPTNFSSLQPAVAPSAIQQIASLFTGTQNTTKMTAAMPGVYNAQTVTPSWFAQSTLLPGIPNVSALLGGAAVLLLLSSVAIGGKVGYRR
jgi:hypothetical protein